MVNNPKLIEEFLEKINNIPTEIFIEAIDEVSREEKKMNRNNTIKNLIESCIDSRDVNIEKAEDGERAFKENNIYVKGKSGEFERYTLVECLPRGTKFVVLINESSSNETGDFSWYFCIMIKYHDLYISLHDRG